MQRYDFQRISQKGIVERLTYITDEEYGHTDAYVPIESLEYIAKIADGGMRDAITLMDKCLAYSTDLTLENVINALGTVDYDIMFSLTSAIGYMENVKMIEIIEKLHNDGKDLKQFVKSYIQFILDINKYYLDCPWKYIQIPQLAEYEQELDNFNDFEVSWFLDLLSELIKINSDIKYSATPKYDIESALIVFMNEEVRE